MGGTGGAAGAESHNHHFLAFHRKRRAHPFPAENQPHHPHSRQLGRRGAETVRGDNLGMAVQPFRKARPQHHRLRPDDPAAAEQGFLLFFRRNVHSRHPQRNLRGMGRDGGLPVEPADNPRKKGVQLRDRERHDHQTAGGSPAADGNKVCRNLQGRQAGHSGLRHKHRRVPV